MFFNTDWCALREELRLPDGFGKKEVERHLLGFYDGLLTIDGDSRDHSRINIRFVSPMFYYFLPFSAVKSLNVHVFSARV